MKKICLLMVVVILAVACSGGRHVAKHKKLDPKKRIPCPHKDC